ncbi:MAG: hypothetical protein GWN00_06615 [Aliifodinibius sp.]|nr:hypothetical protein [Fodinibius sp.]NIX00767.1 hypothetical protein [Phycisphaerae bacterium]NIY24489.1 hypothetical protein [Fodinibius sp.]
MFKDAEFMTAKEKELVLKNWETFLKHGLKKQHFTKRLYNHLHLHCGFIAHYNILGFYSTYFEAGQDTERFFEHFCTYTAANYGANIDYDDLNTAMRDVYSKYRDVIKKQAEDDITSRLDLLEACVKRAKDDREYAREFLGKVRI